MSHRLATTMAVMTIVRSIMLFMGEVTDGSVDVLRAEVAMLEQVGRWSVLCCASTCAFVIAYMML